MKRTRRLLLAASCLVVLGCLVSPARVRAEDIVIIVHRDVRVESLTRAMVSEIYLGTRTKWADESTIKVVMLKKGPVHEMFVKELVGTTPAKLRNVWKKVVFTGTGTPPRIFKHEDDLVEFIAENGGTIGYISPSTPHEGVKVIPLDDGKSVK